MSVIKRPWNRPDVKVYRFDDVSNFQFSRYRSPYRLESKAVDPATGEFLILRPGSGPDPANQFLYGTESEGWTIDGGYSLGGPYREDGVTVTFIRTVNRRGSDGKRLSRSEYDAAPIARMMAGSYYAEMKAARANPRYPQGPMLTKVVIDERPEFP